MTDKPLANLTKMRVEKTQINNIRKEKEKRTTNTKEIQGITGDYFENLYSNKLENLEETNKFLHIHDDLKLKQEDINQLNKSITAMKLKQQ
jgi:hypothetical protein